MNTEPAEISFNCWILGVHDATVFAVDILPSKTVDRLEKAITKEKETGLNHIDADQLDVWMVKRSRAASPPLLTCSDMFTAQGPPP
jgi:hypothetical protein